MGVDLFFQEIGPEKVIINIEEDGTLIEIIGEIKSVTRDGRIVFGPLKREELDAYLTKLTAQDIVSEEDIKELTRMVKEFPHDEGLEIATTERFHAFVVKHRDTFFVEKF